MSFFVVAVISHLFGYKEALYFVACALWGKSLLEIINYVEHYGLARQLNQQIRPHHSWDSHHSVSTWATFILTRHAHHHANAEVPFHNLKQIINAPHTIAGYLACIVISMIPPLWFKLMRPKLVEWDRQYENKLCD